jgi:hypothetical protein
MDQATIRFLGHYGHEYARIYLAHGGNSANTLLKQFFASEREKHRTNVQFYKLRFDMPMYLAARFVVHASRDDGMRVGIVNVNHLEKLNWVVTCPSSNDEDPEVHEA